MVMVAKKKKYNKQGELNYSNNKTTKTKNN